MELWIRSTARTNLLKARFLTIMKGENLYGKYDWEFKGYTICNCNEQGDYELLGTYKTEKRALEVLDEIQKLLMPVITYTQKEPIKSDFGQGVYQIKQDVDLKVQQVSTYVYEMPNE